ncbi:sensor domain-containing diguanylate cyclase [Marinobacter qingdaonensis]|uniref:diguanylate cyclase n=1 Tax=Marinobacter qingdaonensis TaxID=3108486 RepID=A0ABU5NZ05_9GAMM|nr:sensor domain-containing diguanylate cyclase [Marinobacter sp. ASW11-75]MEA1081039.1 sensor domain-containing diguanylate cyclase [Marinobacter sp. ASW11-75]
MPTKKNNNQLVTTSEHLLPFIESLPDAVVIVNADHKIVLVNSRTGEMFGYPVDVLKGADLMTIIPELHRGKHRQKVDAYFQKPVNRPMGAQKRFSGVRADGTEVPVDIMINRITLDGVTVAMALIRDVTYQRELEDRLTLDSLTDEMTGFYNRKHFKTRLEAQRSGFLRSGLPTSVIMFDFDHFKHINDQFGHAGGDIVLVNVASMIQKELRPLDVGCRIGGEEFAIILPNTNLESAVAFAERIRQHIERMEFRVEERRFHATVTLGVATFSSMDRTSDAIMKRADEALYAGKAAGRNCVVSQDALTRTEAD